MSFWKDLGAGVAGVAGGTAGFFTGGPVGAAVGYKAGRDLVNNPEELPIVGSMFGPTDAQQDADRQQQEALQQIEQEYTQYRPISDAAHQQSLQQQLSLFGPINQMLEQMYGPQFKLDFSAFNQSPVSYAKSLEAMSDPQLRSQESQQRFVAEEPSREAALLRNAGNPRY